MIVQPKLKVWRFGEREGLDLGGQEKDGGALTVLGSNEFRSSKVSTRPIPVCVCTEFGLGHKLQLTGER